MNTRNKLNELFIIVLKKYSFLNWNFLFILIKTISYITICYKYFNHQTPLNDNDNIKLTLSLLSN